MASHSVVDYSKWDHLDTDSSEDEAPPPPPPRTLGSAGARRTSEEEEGPSSLEREMERLHSTPALAAAAAGVAEEDWRDWGDRFGGGLPADVLATIAGKVVAQTAAGWAAFLKEDSYSEGDIQWLMEKRKRDGNCLFVFARVCKPWRKAQQKVGGPLCTQVPSDVILPGRASLAKWALAEGCPRIERGRAGWTMAHVAAELDRPELVKWLCGEEGGFRMDLKLMMHVGRRGNLELMKWLRAEGCLWDKRTSKEAARKGQLETLRWALENGCPGDSAVCHWAVLRGHVEMLRWAREFGCPWDPEIRDTAAAELGYTDDFGNLVHDDDYEF